MTGTSFDLKTRNAMIMDMVQQGMSGAFIARTLNLPYPTVATVREKCGVRGEGLANRRFSKALGRLLTKAETAAQNEAILADLRDGASAHVVSLKYDLMPDTIRRIGNDHGVLVRRESTRPLPTAERVEAERVARLLLEQDHHARRVAQHTGLAYSAVRKLAQGMAVAKRARRAERTAGAVYTRLNVPTALHLRIVEMAKAQGITIPQALNDVLAIGMAALDRENADAE